ncbi:MAG: Enoyl-CoA hydratase [Pseudolabrys sp.]|jgi:enoyl-CoA hydratase/carnithine racemase|nr:Enoyl-CoA hydratase [Pseudolabrys sp.]
MDRLVREIAGIRLVRDGSLVEVELNEPERRNPMSPAIMEGLSAACDVIEAEREQTSCVILTGNGSAFCAGGDLPYNDLNLQGEVSTQRIFLEELYRPFLRLLDLPVPTIAAVNGVAIGGGLALAMLCDLRIVSDRARLITAFGRMGFFPGLGLTYSFERLLGPSKALELIYRGAEISALEAVSLGLATTATTPDELMPRARAIAAEIAANSTFVNQLVKSAIMADFRGELRQRLERDILAQVLTSVGGDYRQRRDAIRRARNRPS